MRTGESHASSSGSISVVVERASAGGRVVVTSGYSVTGTGGSVSIASGSSTSSSSGAAFILQMRARLVRRFSSVNRLGIKRIGGSLVIRTDTATSVQLEVSVSRLVMVPRATAVES